MTTTETLTRRVLRLYDQADAEHITHGATWYDRQRDTVASLADAGGYSLEHAVAAVAHLSPRTPWGRNLEGAEALLLEGRKAVGILGGNYERAVASLEADDPAATFGRRALKTRRFYENILGNHQVVTVDVWAMRVVGMTEQELKRMGNYERAERAFQGAARRRGTVPAHVQATTWIQIRNGRTD